MSQVHSAPSNSPRGLARVTADVNSGTLVAEFDPSALDQSSAEQLVADMEPLVEGSLRTCAERYERTGRCEVACAERLVNALDPVCGSDGVITSAKGSVLTLVYSEELLREGTLNEVVRRVGPAMTTDREIQRRPVDGRDERRLRIESAFVGITFFGMVAGLAGQFVDAPTAAVWGAYGLAYLFGGWFGVRASIESLRTRSVDIDLLMILAAIGALVVGAPFEGAMLLFLFSLSNVLQHYAIGRSHDALRSLMKLRPDTARVLRNGEERSVPVEEVSIGDRFVVRPGDRIPLDGVVVDGTCTIDEASLTGESEPAVKEVDDEIFGGTIALDGTLVVRVTRRSDDSAIARIIRLVEHAKSEKAPTQRLIDRVEQPYVLGVFGMTIVAIALPMVVGHPFDPTFYRAITLMVAASPCAVIISTPAAVLSAIAAGARNGVLYKGGAHVEAAGSIDVVALDKTGTITEGAYRVTDVSAHPDGPHAADDVLRLAAAVQSRSEHHLAKATLEAAADRSIDVPTASNFHAAVGRGVRGELDETTVHIGNRRYFAELGQPIERFDDGLAAIRAAHERGDTCTLVAHERSGTVAIIGWISFSDSVRPGAREMVEALHAGGIDRVVMLTGDSEPVARRIAEGVGIDDVRAELVPEQKVEAIEELLAEYGRVAMIGDGVNDAPALATASLGVAMGGAGTDVALESADVVLMSDDLSKVPYLLGLGRATRRTLYTNLAIAFGAILIMVAAILARGIPLPLAVVGHEGSTVVVSLWGIRLLAYR